jgi:pullulanase/glycogen debranching enzyme
MRIWPGDPYPLGAYYDGAGTNFSLFSEVATRVELCLFDDDGRETRIDLTEVDLASTLARELHAVDRLSAFFDLVQQDPVVSQVKLIAEPWEVGEEGRDGTDVLPDAHRGMWTCVLDTTTSYALDDEAIVAEGEKPTVEARSIQVLRRG